MELLVHPHCGNMHTAAMQPANCHPPILYRSGRKIFGHASRRMYAHTTKKSGRSSVLQTLLLPSCKKTVLNYIRTHVLKCRLLFFFSQTDYDAILVVLAKRLHGVTFVRILNT